MYVDYDFVKQLSDERVQAALQDVDEHRRSRNWRRRSLVRTILTQLLLGGAGLILVVLLLSGCTPVSAASLRASVPRESQNPADFPLPYSLDDLVRYYEPHLVAAEADSASPVQSQPLHPWFMDDRFRYLNQLQDGLVVLDEPEAKDAKNLRRFGLEDRY
jgi:hypothetical protein